ncbi:MAG: IS110 family transposase, partial [Betaproteobacteria bacterium]
MTTVYAGLDWASRSHAVCVIDEQGAVCRQWALAHDADGLRDLVRQLRALSVQRIAIERPSGLLVDALVEAQFTVVPIHPNVVKASRPRYRSHGGKSDAGDAYLLADLLRTDGHRFAPLAAQADDIRALRALVRGRDDLVAARVRLANQLRSLLDSYWPGAAEAFAEIDSPIALAFLQRYPKPEAAARLGPNRMAAFCAQHAYSGRRCPEELPARLHQAAHIDLGELEVDAKAELTLGLVRTLVCLVEQIRLRSSRIEHQVAAGDDGGLLMSFPRAGRLCAAPILAELGSVRERFGSDAQLAAEAGVAPVTYASGKHQAVIFRWACNHRLRAALTCLADNSRHASTWAAGVYA